MRKTGKNNRRPVLANKSPVHTVENRGFQPVAGYVRFRMVARPVGLTTSSVRSAVVSCFRSLVLVESAELSLALPGHRGLLRICCRTFCGSSRRSLLFSRRSPGPILTCWHKCITIYRRLSTAYK